VRIHLVDGLLADLLQDVRYFMCVSYINIPYRSETFGGEDFEVNKPILYHIFSIFVVSSTVQSIAEPEITFKNWPENVQPK
jgi:hypothetical protein